MRINFIKDILKEGKDLEISRYSASLAFYAIYILAPMAIIFVSVIGFVVGPNLAGEQLVGYFEDRAGGQIVPLIERLLTIPIQTQTNIFFSIIGILLMAYGLYHFFGTLRKALFSIFDLEKRFEGQQNKIFSNPAKKISFSFYLGVLIFLLIFSNTVTPALSGFFTVTLVRDIPFLEFFLSFLLTVAVLFGMYKTVSLNTLSWKEALLGAVVGSILFSLLNIALSLYFSLFRSVHLIYGASSSVIAFLLWVYYSVQILLIGAMSSRVVRDLKK